MWRIQNAIRRSAMISYFIMELICLPAAGASIERPDKNALLEKLQEDPRRKDERKAFEAMVVKVKDGDSIVIKNHDTGNEEEVRLFGVDTPEKDQAYGSEARQFTQKQVKDKKIVVVPFYKDKLKRTIAVVVCEDGELLENKLVHEGWAWWYDRYDPHNTELEILQKEARDKKIGLWADENPLKPEDYRKKQFESGQWKVIDNVLHMTKDGKLVPEDEY